MPLKSNCAPGSRSWLPPAFPQNTCKRNVLAICVLGLLSGNAHAQTFKARFLNPNVYRTQVDFKAVRVAEIRKVPHTRRRIPFFWLTKSTTRREFLVTPKDTFLVQVDATAQTPPTVMPPPASPGPAGVLVLPGGVARHFLDYKIVSEDENGFAVIRILPRVVITTAATATTTPLATTTTTITASPTTTVVSSTTPATATATTTTTTTTEALAPASTTTTTTTTTTTRAWVLRRFTPTPSAPTQLKSDPLNGYNYLFAVKKDEFPALAKTYMGGKFWGTPIVHPFKLRPTQANLGPQLYADITISYCFGYRARLSRNQLKENFVTFVPFGVGVGAAKHQRRLADSQLSDEEDNAAITYWQGGVFFTIRKVGFGVFSGVDAMIGHKNDWIYQSKPWFSFGVGYKFKED